MHLTLAILRRLFPVTKGVHGLVLTFEQKIALRIAIVSLVLASIASPLAWYISREKAERGVVSFAMEESRRLLMHQSAEAAAHALAGGLFEVAEIYDAHGIKLAEAMTNKGRLIENELPEHLPPRYQDSFYESLWLYGDLWTLRVFTPLRSDDGTLTGYFEGVRVVPVWQRDQIFVDSLAVAIMVGLASLFRGAALYPAMIRLFSENQRKTRELLESHISMIESFGRAIAKRDNNTGAHNYRVAWTSVTLAETLGIDGEKMQSLIAGSFLHDVGKIGIPDRILLKPGKLSDEEMNKMRTHVGMGEEILMGAGWLDGAKDVVAGHHEKWDGSGYPRGQAGTAIPLLARIFAIVDVFDALCSKRPYKEALPLNEVMSILQQGSGSHFDPDLIKNFSSIAGTVYETITNASEEEIKDLMRNMVRRYFDI